MAKGPTAEQAAKLAKATYEEFLEEPERSKQIANIPKLVKKFEGDYGKMVKALQSKYGKATPKKKAAEPEVVEEPPVEVAEEAPPKKKKAPAKEEVAEETKQVGLVALRLSEAMIRDQIRRTRIILIGELR